ncbi:hypothetical protein BOTBODRAFT_165142 [Botryobasidium botryosum FD-172 SS1]|uniref:Translocation protein SEC62 n=1 Tax=Botryobasidium botryosum (strain FD-172 SS1) TaxID=930990 RepID=A0A067M045_BOTB1|nr:hypothetical protein BOTBODRAFT_165142 [Botryobasidium botryosum FD-172 SS1]
MQQQRDAPPELLNIVKFLRNAGKSSVKARTGNLNGKRIDYFKGKSALTAVLSPAYAKLSGVPPQPASEAEGIALLNRIIPFAFFLRVERGQASGATPKPLQIIPQQQFLPDEYYAWFYDGPQWTTYIGGVGLIAVMLAAVMFPLWPMSMRLGVYYLSMGMLGLIGLFFAIAIVRLIFYIITVVVASPGIWIFPKLFADVGFVESFIPGWDWDLPPKKKSRKNKAGKEGEANGKGSKTKTKAADATAPAAPAPAGQPAYRGATIEEVAE